MSGESEALRELAEQVDAFLVQMDIDPDRTPEGLYVLGYGSTVVLVSLFEAGGRCYVRFASLIVSEIRPPSLELVIKLFRLNTLVLFGAFQIFEDNALVFSHTLLAEGLTLDGFRHTLEYIARVADDHDEDIQVLAGGKRAEDLLSDAS